VIEKQSVSLRGSGRLVKADLTPGFAGVEGKIFSRYDSPPDQRIRVITRWR